MRHLLQERIDSCITDDIDFERSAFVKCGCGKIWREGDDYEKKGGLFARVCGRCSLGNCNHVKHKEYKLVRV